MKYYKHHVFFCLNQRDDNAQCCMDCDAENIFLYMKDKIKNMKLRGYKKCRVNRAGCFDRCKDGPLLVIYPDDTWYRYFDRNDIDEIISEHIVKGKIVERLLV